MQTVLEILDQPLSLLLADFTICTSCKFVDRDSNRARVGHECSVCGALSAGARFYYSLSVTSLIDLMQEFFHFNASALPTLETTQQNKRNHLLAVVIFFCTLGEVLLQDFLIECMRKERLPEKVQERLLKDNMYVKQRVEKLFPILTGESWSRAIKQLSRNNKLDYVETARFFREVADKRNLLLHSGDKWAVPSDMPKNCMCHIWPLLCLFVGLHNEYLVENSSNV